MDDLVPEAGNLENFINQFEVFASAPGGVDELRDLILGLAIEGKLVNNNSSEYKPENLKVSADKVPKAQHYKKGKKLKQVEILETPFNLPSSWCWVRLGEIGANWGQAKPEHEFTYIDVSAIDNTSGRVVSPNTIQPQDAPSRARKLVKKDTVIYSTVRPYLKNIAVIDKDFSPMPIASTAFAIIHPFDAVLPKFIYFYLRSPLFVSYVESVQKGVAYPAINDEKFFMGIFPLPPLEEQKRIVAKVDELMVLCDTLEAQQQQQAQTVLRANTAAINALLNPVPQSEQNSPKTTEKETNTTTENSFEQNWQRIAQHFNTLYGCTLPMPKGQGRKKKYLVGLENVKALRGAILDLAVSGNLIEQNSESTSVDNELDEIKAVKMEVLKKRIIREPKSFDRSKINQPPFAHRKGWIWLPLADVVFFQEGPGIRNWQFRENGIKLINVKNLVNGNLFLENSDKFVSEVEFLEKYSHFEIEEGDLLWASSGNSWGKTGFFNDQSYRVMMNTSMIRLRFYSKKWNNKYLRIILDTRLFKDQILDQLQGIQPNFGPLHLRQVILPIPPAEEQKRIVTKVDQLMALCDQLEQQLTQSYSDAEKLMQATVKALVA